MHPKFWEVSNTKEPLSALKNKEAWYLNDTINGVYPRADLSLNAQKAKLIE